jgi:hypothetical protein
VSKPKNQQESSVPIEVELQAHLMEQLISGREPPGIVYHYTTGAGLLGITQEKCLWATDILYLNDAKEYEYTLTLASTHLAELAENITPGSDSSLLEACTNGLGYVSAQTVYVVSFSKHPDQLSQWRAYGRGTGFAIGLAPQVLMHATKDYVHAPAWLPCVYSKAEQMRLLEYATSYIMERFRSSEMPPPAAGRDARATHLLKFALAFLGHLIVLACCFKHSAFEEEAEWRLLFQQSYQGLEPAPDLNFRPGIPTIVPYLSVPLTSKDSPLRFEQVVVGPNPHMKLALEAVNRLLRQREVLHEEEAVRASDIPFRDW